MACNLRQGIKLSKFQQFMDSLFRPQKRTLLVFISVQVDNSRLLGGQVTVNMVCNEILESKVTPLPTVYNIIENNQYDIRSSLG
jgi:hypothetical protein